MKTHTSIKKIKNMYSKVYKTGYSNLYYIFKYVDPVYYNAGLYGWNCDVYIDIKNDVAITTGYRNMAGVLIPSELIKKYTDIAKSILNDPNIKKYEDIKTALDLNRNNFINELLTL